MADLLTIIAAIIYFLVFITVLATAFIYYVVHQYKPNIMLWATFLLLMAISIEFFIVFLVKFLSVINTTDLFHPIRNYFYIPTRMIVLIAAIYFLKTSVRKIDRKNANVSVQS